MEANSNLNISNEILLKSAEATEKLIPTKSTDRYNKEYQHFCEWEKVYQVDKIDEDVMLAYFLDVVSTIF